MKEGSPLEAMFRDEKRRQRLAATTERAVTAKGKSVLVPEVVLRGDLEIGRFEVTRAQFAEFDKNYKIEPGTENYPGERRSRSIRRRRTPRGCRRRPGKPGGSRTRAKSPRMYEKKDGENTLDYWAGYSLNPDDVARAAEKTDELSGNAPLLKPVGSFAGQGKDNEELIFDLGGNVAEWVVATDGKGKAIGGSADQPTDPRASHEPAPRYVGLRVVRGAEQVEH